MKTSINRQSRAPRYLSCEEQRRLLEACDRVAGAHAPLWRGVISLGLETAARLGEMQDATWADFDLAARVWTLRGSRRERPRAVPLTDEALAALQLLGSASALPTERVVSPTSGRDFSVLRFASLAASAGLRDLRISDLRREAIYRMVNPPRALNDKQVMAMVGHGSLAQLPYDEMRARWRRLSGSGSQTECTASAD